MTDAGTDALRRPLRSRQSRWARWTATKLAARGVRPNAISIASVCFAVLGGAALLFVRETPPVGRAFLFFGAAACIQLRLVCNLLDGMVAIEGGARTKSGEVYNELPDRLADLLFLVPAGYAANVSAPWGELAGWMAGSLALLTAYVRALGTSAGTQPDFRGPMAKPHRMAVLTMGCILSAVQTIRGWPASVDWLLVALCVIVVGSAVTVARRTIRVVRELESR